MAKEGGRDEVESDREKEGVKEGVASIALLPSGYISGHFIHLPYSICYGLHGTGVRAWYSSPHWMRIVLFLFIHHLTSGRTSAGILTASYPVKGSAAESGKEQTVVVECRGHDAAHFQNIDHAHGWEKDVVAMTEREHVKKKISVSFACETLKSDEAAEEHIKKFMPKLSALDAVVNIGHMRISG